MNNLTKSIYEILAEKYGGKFVATKSFNSVDVITSGESIEEVSKDAIKNYKILNPYIFYIPEKGEDIAYSQN